MAYKDSSLLQILRLSINDPVAKILQNAGLQNTDGKTGMSTIPFKDTIMQGFVSDHQTTYNGFKAKPQLFLEADVKVKKLRVVSAYNSNGGFIETYIRGLVVTSGTVNTGIAFGEGTGYFLKQPKSATTKSFKVTNNGHGSFLITTKSAGKGATYLHDIGTTPTLGFPPLTQNKGEMLVSHEASSTVNDLTTGTIYAFREAIIMPIPRKKKSTTLTSIEKLTTPTVSGKAHRAYFSYTAPSHYQWSDWQYATAT